MQEHESASFPKMWEILLETKLFDKDKSIFGRTATQLRTFFSSGHRKKMGGGQ